MKRLLILFPLIFLCGCSVINRNCVAVCGGQDVKIIDMSMSEGTDIKTTWQWNSEDPQADIPEDYRRLMRNIDECKFVDRNRKLLLTASGDGMMLLDLKTKKVITYAHVPMAHSADLLPKGRIAVALSTHKQGNALELYDERWPDKVIYRDSLYSGHGVVWNRKRQSLYALGYSELREYKLVDWKSDTPSLKCVSTWKLPVSSGHDLSPVGDDLMIVSGGNGVVWFDIDKEEFAPFGPLKDKKNIKSVNFNRKDGRLVYTQAEISWWTHNIYQKNPDKTITIDSIDLYKVRPAWK